MTLLNTSSKKWALQRLHGEGLQAKFRGVLGKAWTAVGSLMSSELGQSRDLQPSLRLPCPEAFPQLHRKVLELPVSRGRGAPSHEKNCKVGD